MVDKADPHWYFSERFKYTLSEVQINSCVVLMFNVQRSNKTKVSFDSGVNSIVCFGFIPHFVRSSSSRNGIKFTQTLLAWQIENSVDQQTPPAIILTQQSDYERWCNSSAHQIYNQSASIDPSALDLGHYLQTHRLTYVYTHSLTSLSDFETIRRTVCGNQTLLKLTKKPTGTFYCFKW